MCYSNILRLCPLTSRLSAYTLIIFVMPMTRTEVIHINARMLRAQPACQQHQTLIIEEFEPDVFRQLIEYIHTGCVTLQPRTLLGKLEYVPQERPVDN